MIHNLTSGGGGTSLNFKVVGGTTQPTSPKENTIWVKTAIDIPAAYLNKGPTPTWANSKGAVAISYEPIRGTGNITPTTATLNLIKSGAGGIGGIYAMLNACYQNQDGTAAGWEQMDAYIYKGGQWTSVVTYLYNRGDECKELTGGWSNDGYASNAGIAVSAPQKESGYAIIGFDKSDNSTRWNGMGTNVPINIPGNVNRLRVTAKILAQNKDYAGHIFISKDKAKINGSSSQISMTEISGTVGDTVVTYVDVSGITGDVYIALTTYIPAGTIAQIELHTVEMVS